jgi:hypothetical protein
MSSTCRELPTVEECLEGANAINPRENERLWSCVRQQCTRITIRCDQVVRKRCDDAHQRGDPIMGYTFQPMGTSPFFPAKETYWCEDSADPDCLTRAFVHELAHSCGWEHGMGQGVPGNRGAIRCQ